MKKIIASIATALFIAALAGCGVNDQAQNDNSTLDQAALYTDDKNANRNNGAFRYVNDRGFNDQQMVDQVNVLNNNNHLGDRKGAFSSGPNPNYGYNDYNYHGQLNTTYNGIPTKSYNTGHENVIAQKITDRIEHVTNVNDVAVIIDGNSILVALDTNEDNNQKIERRVRRIVEGMADGRKVKVVTDKGMFTRVKNVTTY